jgi:glycosyltransferase involved in cell wall biosynthesis
VRVAVIHGYYLHDSGSGIYVREVVRELVRRGHDVTLVCQERSPELYDFVDTVYVAGENNLEPVRLGGVRPPLYEGRCRLVRPQLRRLLVYVDGPFPGFEAEQVRAFQDSPTEWIEAYVLENASALRAIFAAWPPDLVLANHAMMAPYLVKQALAAAAPYVVTVHGSELNFSVKHDRRLAPFTLEGLEAAAAVVTVSEPGAAEVITWAAEHGMDMATKTWAIPPGVDARTFAPASDRMTAIEALTREVPLPDELQLRPEDRIIVYAGRLMWTKGIQYAVCCLPRVLAHYPSVRLLIAGEGPAQAPLAELAALLGEGDEAAARALALRSAELRAPPEFGELVPGTVPRVGPLPIHFLGHLNSAQLGRLFAAADVSLAPSVFPEAVGLVTIEALSAGALPLASFHSGLAPIVDVVADALADPLLRALAPGRCLTEELSRLTIHVLGRYPTASFAFRDQLHDLCRLRFASWGKVAERYLELARGGTGAPGAGRGTSAASEPSW